MTEKPLFITSAMRIAGEHIHTLVETAQKTHYRRRVVLLTGKYEGRVAEINGVTFDPHADVWLFCCMVLRVDGDGYLNTDGESRAYRPVGEFRDE